MRKLLVVLLCLFSTNALAAIHRYNLRVVSSSSGQRIPQFVLADTEAELPTSSVGEGDFGYAKDTNKFYTYSGAAWASVASAGGAPADAKFIVAELHPDLSSEIAPAGDDRVPLSSSASAVSWVAIPDCDAGFQSLTYDTGTNTFTCLNIAHPLMRSARHSDTSDADPDGDTVILSDGSTWKAALVPDCDADNQTLAYDQTTHAFSCGDDDTGSGGSPLTTDGDIYYRAAGADARLPKGTTDQVLTMVASGGPGSEMPTWQSPTFAPDSPAYWVSSGHLGLTGEQDMGTIGTGLILNTVTFGIGTPSQYAGTTCTNQFVRSLNNSGAATCNTVSLTADVTGTLPVANGGERSTMMRLAANSALSTTTFTNLTGFSMSLAASTNYSFLCRFFTTANAATVGVQFEIDYSGTLTAGQVNFQGPGTATTLLWISDTTASFTFQPTASQGNVAGTVELSGTLEVNTSGTLQFQHASETATLTTVLRGSFCEILRH